MITEAQSNALDAFVKADAEALVSAKMALTFAVDDQRASPRIRKMFKTALAFYQTPQFSKILDAS